MKDEPGQANEEQRYCGLLGTTNASFRYKEWKGSNKFLCGGRLIMGLHVSHLNTSLLLIIFSWVEYAFLVIPVLNDSRLYAVPFIGVTINVVFLFCTAFADPGILPRQHFHNGYHEEANAIRKDAAILKSNFCRICNIWRPYRARHCKYCDNCVDIFDHHCPWTGTCIGIRNYPQFFLFIVSVWLGAILVLLSAVYILLCWVLAGATTDRYYLRILALAVTIPWTLLILFAVGSLLSFHVFLIFRGQTTNEYFRERRVRQQPPPSPWPPVVPAAALSPSEAAAQRLMDNNADAVEAMIAPTGSARCLKLILWKAGNSATPSITKTSDVTEMVTDNTSNRATVGSHHTSCNSTAMEGLQLPPVGTNARSSAGARNYYDSAFAVDQVLTPLYDVDSTPFPQLSPSPRSPHKQHSTNSAKYTPVRLSLEEPEDETRIDAGGVDNTGALLSPSSHTGSPLSLSPPEKDHFESLSPENTLLLQQMRADLAQHRRNLTIGIGSGAHNPEPSLTLIFPPPAVEEENNVQGHSASNANDYVKKPNKLELLRRRKEQYSMTPAETSRGVLSTLACLPCGAVVCALRLCGCVRAPGPPAAAPYGRNSHTIVPHSPRSLRPAVNVRYTYHYLCCMVPIIPRSKLLPLWRRVDEQDQEQQQYLLEVLMEKIEEAQRWDDEMDNDHSV